jgi:hypothetical protein
MAGGVEVVGGGGGAAGRGGVASREPHDAVAATSGTMNAIVATLRPHGLTMPAMIAAIHRSSPPGREADIQSPIDSGEPQDSGRASPPAGTS